MLSIDVHANARRLDRAMALLLLSRADIGRDRNCLLVLAECIDGQQARFPALPDERAFAWGRVPGIKKYSIDLHDRERVLDAAVDAWSKSVVRQAPFASFNWPAAR